MWNAVWSISESLAPWLFLGTAVTGLLHVYLPSNFLRKHLTGQRSVLKAVAFGVPMPLCSCGVIPTGLGLKKEGASDGAAIGFLISTPQTGIDSIMVSASFLGWPFAIFKVLSAFITGWIGGALSNYGETDTETHSSSTGTETKVTIRDGFEHAVQVLRSIWKWLVFGILASAVITVYVPQESFASLATAGSLAACLGILVISAPLYVCATASVPIAAALVQQGLPMSAALVFLMAGPATNVATMGTIYRTFGARKLSIYLATIIMGSLAFGLALDTVIAVPQVEIMNHEHGETLWAQISAGLLFACLTFFALEELVKKLPKQQSTSIEPELTLSIQGMSCGGCVGKIEKALSGRPDVSGIEINLADASAKIRGNIAKEEACDIVNKLGFEAS